VPKSCQIGWGFRGKGLFFFALGIVFLGFPIVGVAQQIVVASTSLAGAIARAAGAKEVRVIAPEGLTHPPEYDLKPSDLIKVEGAAMVVYGGYEKMVSKLADTSKSKNLVALQIDTATSPENLITQARKISKVLRTEKDEEAWEARFMERVNALQKGLAPFSGKRAAVHFHAQPFARWARLSIIQVFRPGELTPRAISEAIAQSPEVVVDILHLPMAKVIADNAKCRYIQVINFPGVENTKTLEDLFEYNSAQLIRAFR